MRTVNSNGRSRRGMPREHEAHDQRPAAMIRAGGGRGIAKDKAHTRTMNPLQPQASSTSGPCVRRTMLAIGLLGLLSLAGPTIAARWAGELETVNGTIWRGALRGDSVIVRASWQRDSCGEGSADDAGTRLYGGIWILNSQGGVAWNDFTAVPRCSRVHVTSVPWRAGLLLTVTARSVPCASAADCERKQYIYVASLRSIASSGWVGLHWNPWITRFVEGTAKVDGIEYAATLEPTLRNGAITFEAAMPAGAHEGSLIERDVTAMDPELLAVQSRSSPSRITFYPNAASSEPSTVHISPKERVKIVSVVSRAVAEPDGTLHPALFRVGVRVGGRRGYLPPAWLRSVGYPLREVGLGERAREARFWVVEPPSHLVAYSSALEMLGGVKLPDFASMEPARILVNRRGQLLVPVSSDSVWIWDGAKWRQRARHTNAAYLQRGSCDRSWYLGADSSAFLLETSTITWPGAFDVDSAYNAARFEETDFDLKPRRTIFDLPYERCEDNMSQVVAFTGPCEEALVVASNGVVDSFFVLVRMVPGQMPSEGSVAWAKADRSLFVRARSQWRSTAWPSAQSYFDRGETMIGSVEDNACCGASNENSNQSWITRHGVSLVFFDEWARFHNENCDVSFFADGLVPAPDRHAIGFTIRAEGAPTASTDGTPDQNELRRVEASLAELPVAEVTTLDPAPTTRWRAEHAEFVGWLDSDRVLIVQQGTLVVVNVRNGSRSEPGIRVRGIEDVILVTP
ncbi:MAG: hypothetical protein U0704_12795 [Candidatus Eisenbacteria bacterium]